MRWLCLPLGLSVLVAAFAWAKADKRTPWPALAALLSLMLCVVGLLLLFVPDFFG